MSDSQRAFWEGFQKDFIECAMMAPWVLLFLWLAYRKTDKWYHILLAAVVIALLGTWSILLTNAWSAFIIGAGTSSGQPPAQY